MTLITKFKSGKVVTYTEVDDVEQDDNYLYVYMRDGSIVRGRCRSISYYIERYETGHEFCIYPDKGRYHY